MLLSVLALLWLSGCSGGGSGVTPAAGPIPSPAQVTQTRFDPTTSRLTDIPVPNDILRSSTTGLNNLPGTGEPFASFNSIAGFANSGALTIPFTGGVLASTVSSSTIILFDKTAQANVTVNLSLSADSGGNSTVTVTPLRPLTPTHSYVCIVTPGVGSAQGGAPVASDTFGSYTRLTTPLVDASGRSTIFGLSPFLAAQLEPVRLAYQPVWATAEQVTHLDRGTIPGAFGFTTQPLFNTAKFLRANAQTQSPVLANQSIIAANGAAVNTFFAGNRVGPLGSSQVPLSIVPHNFIQGIEEFTFQSTSYIQNPLSGPFIESGSGAGRTVQANGSSTIRVLVFLPAPTATPPPPGGWPTIIFQHGVTRDRTDAYFVANAACQIGFAVISMDLPLHGARSLPGAVASGDGFINLDNARMFRDNLRQSIADQAVLVRLLTSGGGALFSTTNIQYLGHSIGSIIGTCTLAVEPNITRAVLNVPGGRWLSLAENSPAFAPLVNGGLAAKGIYPGSSDFFGFLFMAQTVVDDADPFNYGAHLGFGLNDLGGNGTLSYLVQEMIGDATVPNSATADLVRAMNIPIVKTIANAVVSPIVGLPTAVLSPFPGNGLFQFTGGGHGSLLGPSGPDVTAAVTALVQNQVFTKVFVGLTFATQHPSKAPAPALAGSGVDMTPQLGPRLFWPSH